VACFRETLQVRNIEASGNLLANIFLHKFNFFFVEMYIISELLRYHASELQLAEPRATFVPSPRLEHLRVILTSVLTSLST